MGCQPTRALNHQSNLSLSLSLSPPPPPASLALSHSLLPSLPLPPYLSLSRTSRSLRLSKLLLRKLVHNQFGFLKSKTKSLKPWIWFHILWLNYCCITILCNLLPLPPYCNGSVAWTIKLSYLYSYSLSRLPFPFPLSLLPPLVLLHPHSPHPPPVPLLSHFYFLTSHLCKYLQSVRPTLPPDKKKVM